MSFLRIGLMMFALCLVSCQARMCFNCSNYESSQCDRELLAESYANTNCESGFNYCGLTIVEEVKNGKKVVDVMRGCVKEVVRNECKTTSKNGATTKTCSDTCAWDNCNVQMPLQFTTTTTTTKATTTTQSNNGAGDVVASRLLVLAIGGVSALVALKL